MDVLNMKYRSQVNEFYKNLNKFLFFKTTYLKFGRWQQMQNFSTIISPKLSQLGTKNTRTLGVIEYHYSLIDVYEQKVAQKISLGWVGVASG